MNIQQETDGKRGAFFIEEGAKRIAEMIYVMAEPKKMIIEHTEVEESMRDQGLGLKLLYELVDFARDQKISVVPECSYAEVMFQKNEELRDVLS
ncbi:N-acetyltransferase [Algoriphagus ratkowskyi]|uniref:N-acetyltransferase n=1 Tax=Algoriphagus ratkowskyi TaxID=57028 RepID=A0ABY3HHU1_9BACT|nr:N-acetyltransferase [Algoriphagus ratkowskyi]